MKYQIQQSKLIRLHYYLKFLIPRYCQITLRKLRAKRIRPQCADIWPINPKAANKPPNWPGWPEGKKFSFVLTHDVESSLGCSRCIVLMKLEESLGFRSSFNFVANDYSIPEDIHNLLSRKGFEVGIHGLHHDARMYFSRKNFMHYANQINDFIKKWNTVGFRSPSMYHNLEWLHALNMEYDASTFDTDPFEPQPDEVRTIFPFWVPHRDNTTGYIELPYTLPQDFTLFVVLGEKSIDIWKKKLDWIVENGGMALFITHPDYMIWNPKNPKREEYPVMYYREFLEYVRDKYQGEYWQALPREVASFYKAYCLTNSNQSSKNAAKNLKICMPTYSFYNSDNRVRRYAESLVAEGSTVDIFCLRKKDELKFEEINGIRVYRIKKREKNEKNKLTYFLRLVFFLLQSTLKITCNHLKKPYDIVHVHNIPDFEVFSAIIPKLTGSKVILDIHDIVPELFCSKFKKHVNSMYFRILYLIERLSTSFADHVIISNEIWGNRITNRSTGRDKCTVLINYPDPSIFSRQYNKKNGTRDYIIYPGSLNWHQGLDIALKAFAAIKDQTPNLDFHIYGGGPALEDLKLLSAQLRIQDRVQFKGSTSIEQIAEIMANAKCGIVPKRADLFGNEAFSTKVLEFMALGIPVVLSETSVDKYYFNSSQVLFFESGNVKNLAEKLLLLLTHEELRKKLINNSLDFVKQNNWDQKKHIYFSIIDSLMKEKSAAKSRE